MDIIQQLQEFRQMFEEGAGPLVEATVPAALFLNDICEALGLEAPARAAVLGAETALAVQQYQDEPADLVELVMQQEEQGGVWFVNAEPPGFGPWGSVKTVRA